MERTVRMTMQQLEDLAYLMERHEQVCSNPEYKEAHKAAKIALYKLTDLYKRDGAKPWSYLECDNHSTTAG